MQALVDNSSHHGYSSQPFELSFLGVTFVRRQTRSADMESQQVVKVTSVPRDFDKNEVTFSKIGDNCVNSSARLQKSCETFLELPSLENSLSRVIVNETELSPLPCAGRRFTPVEIHEHNRENQENRLILYKGKVYDSQLIKKSILSSLQHRPDNDLSTVVNDQVNDDLEDDALNKTRVLAEMLIQFTSSNFVSLNVTKMDLFNEALSPFCVGALCRPGDARYWEDIRRNVRLVLNDLIRADAEDRISVYEHEYMRLLQRWMKKYRDTDPKGDNQPPGDGNQSAFPLPEDVAENKNTLREWMETWDRFDFRVPETGAWSRCDEDTDFDLGDPDEIFARSLKSHVDPAPFVTHIDGEAGWAVIPEGLFADDIMTEEQKWTEEFRRSRSDMLDLKRMERRRMKLLRYFIDRYRLSLCEVQIYAEWSQRMQDSERQFLRLC
ncbi:uncharacterized protein LOC131941027 [Physella acuta]|uniref:uncharacterized protein LOC131941027 n=1 Tax=Physella acuta TaxID=109671 RepID=UPI0027DE4A16|nr:uncharacterized protein LOC131941027 [Physella acuta]